MKEINLRRFDLNLLVIFDVLMSEGSVTRAAQRLGRTQSAVSHALARLREQVDDPLMVKVGRRMEPSPFAQRLIDELRPTLRNIRQMLAPPPPFDPATSARVFRLVIADLAPSAMPHVLARVREQAPRVAIQWELPGPNTLASIADAQVDLALLGTTTTWPDGVVRTLVGELPARTFARKDHPALDTWGRTAWMRYPHVQVALGQRERTTIDDVVERERVARFIGAYIPSFSSALELVSRTDLLATLPLLVSDDALEQAGVRAVPAPLNIEPVPLWVAWSFRQSNDSGNRWLRALFTESLVQLLQEGSSRSARPAKRKPKR